jgi:3'-phosphoadenosine 5'-phosphosulfate sulfotransferase (PAPS reductase)/FAD synthetase
MDQTMKALAFSGGKDSWACLHLLRESLQCAIFVDTGFAYPETIEQVNAAAQVVPMYIVQSHRAVQNEREGIPSDVVPMEWTVLGQRMTTTKPVTIQSHFLCCYENIARPLLEKAHELGVTELVYGQRNDESHRSTSRDGDLVEGMVRRHPIEHWTRQQVMDYLATQMSIPAHFALTHSSLDCYDCTGFTASSQDRLAWTKATYPDRYLAYAQRSNILTSALQEALACNL